MVKRKRRAALRKAAASPQPVRAKALDAFSNVLARLGAGTPNLLEGTEYSLSRMSRDYNTLNALYRESWIVRRIVDVIPADMLKNWLTITSGLDPNVEKKLSLTLRRTQLIDKLKRGMQWGRLYGGAIGVMLIAHQGYDLSQPLRMDWIMPGDFQGLLIFDRWNGVNPSSELIEDISDPDYGYPCYYTIDDPAGGGSVKIHHSRIIRFVGNLLPWWEESRSSSGERRLLNPCLMSSKSGTTSPGILPSSRLWQILGCSKCRTSGNCCLRPIVNRRASCSVRWKRRTCC